MEELKKRIESVLFSSGRKMHISEIARLIGVVDITAVKVALEDLKRKHGEDSSLLLIQEGDEWKLTVKEKYIPIVHKLVTKTELTKTLTETLAVIAYKAPVLQSQIIKIRTNKAYDHLRELEGAGYITRSKHGRTKMIKLAPKFFEYFDIPPEQLKERFKSVQQLEKAVDEKEAELRERKADIEQKKEESKEKDEERKKMVAEESEKLEKEISEIERSPEISPDGSPEVDIIDNKGKKHKLKQYASEKVEGTIFEKPAPTMPPYKETVGKLDVYETGMTLEEKEELVKEAEKELEIEEQEEIKEKAEQKAKKSAKRKLAEAEGAEEIGESEEPGLAEEETEEENGEGPEGKEEAIPEEREKAQPQDTSPKNTPESIEEQARKIAEAKMKGGPDFNAERLFAKGIPPGIQAKIDARVEEMIHGEKKKKPEAYFGESGSGEEAEEQSATEEPKETEENKEEEEGSEEPAAKEESEGSEKDERSEVEEGESETEKKGDAKDAYG